MKFITKKVINGKGYYYFQYEGESKIVGEIIDDEIQNKLSDFFINLSEIKHERLSESIKKEFPYSDLKRLERDHYLYTCFSKSEFFQKKNFDLMKNFSIYFTYNSNRSEGSKVSRPEIEKIAFSSKTIPKTRTEREVMNSFNALNFAFSGRMKWNLKSIKMIHNILLNGLDDRDFVGMWKKEDNVAPGNQMTVKYKNVQQEMKKLIDWLDNSFKKDVYPPLLALKFYVAFERIHPFLDGNGRVGRILLNAILHKYRYMPVIFFTKNHVSHCEAIKQAIFGRFSKMKKHFVLQSKKTSDILFV